MKIENFTNLKRYIYATILLLPATVFLAGCFQLNIDIGVDEHFTSYLTYGIELDMSGIDPQYHETLANALNNFGWHYQEQLGFIVAVENDSKTSTLTMKKSIHNDNLPEAFESLKAMLTDESITAFMMVDMSLESYPRVDSYTISAMLDMPQIIKLSSAKELAPDFLLMLEEGLETSGGTVTLSIPASELSASSHTADIYNQLAVMPVPLDFSTQTGFNFRGSVVYSEDGAQIGTIDEIISDAAYTMEIILIVCGCALALLLIILLVLLLKIRKHNKLYE